MNKIIEKSFINIFIIIIYANAIDLIFKKIEIIFKAQKYHKNFIFKTYIINFRIFDIIIFKRYKIFIIVKIDKRNRFYEIEINKFIEL